MKRIGRSGQAASVEVPIEPTINAVQARSSDTYACTLLLLRKFAIVSSTIIAEAWNAP